MAVKGSATVTLSQYRDTESVTRYYKLQSSSLAAPDKPANVKPNETPAGWSKSEPACDITKTLYTCDVTVFSDKTTHVSDVSKSTSYEAAKEAWNKANNAQGTANEAKKYTDNALNNYGYQYSAEIEVAGDPNTYYPVMIYGPSEQDVMREILVKRSFSDKAPAEWNGHPTTHGIGCTCKIKCNFGEWGGADYDWRIHELNEMYGHAFGGCKTDDSGLMFFIFLRGGGAKYYLYSDMRMDDVFPSRFNPTTTDGPSIWYNGNMVAWRGGTAENPERTFCAPHPRQRTEAVIKEIHDKTYIQVATDAYENADKAQNAADKAQSSADKAQNTATEAAKTADNYISSDSTGIMVSENKGATKETPRNATKNNVLITEKDVQIRNGQKVLASYGGTIVLGAEGEQRLEITKNGVVARDGQNTLAKFTSNGMQIGGLSGNNMEIKDNKVSIRSGAIETLAIESVPTSHSVTTTYVFRGSEADSALTAGEIYTESHLISNPVKINSFEITNESGKKPGWSTYDCSIVDGSHIVITIDPSNDGANAIDWSEYTKFIITYESGTVESTVKCNNIEASGANGNMISYTKITSGTGNAQNKKGTVTVINWSTCGCVATVRATFKATEAVAAGTDMCTGTFTGIPKPVLGARGAGAYSKNPMIFGIGEDGGYFVRNCGTGSIASGKTAQGILVYMTDGTFISATGAMPGGGM